MSAPARATRELLEASRALQAAVGAGDPARLEAALARRSAAFEGVREALGDPALAGGEAYAAIQAVRALDESILASAREAAAALRRELEGVAAARRAARALRAQQASDAGPRFVERRA
jgi:hypothetical protein